MGSFKVLTTLFFWIQSSWQLSLLELPFLLRPCFFWRSYTYQHSEFLLRLLRLVYLHCSIRPPLLMQHPCSTLAFIALILLPTFYLLPLHPDHRLMLLAISLHLMLLLPPLTSSGFSSGMLGVSEP